MKYHLPKRDIEISGAQKRTQCNIQINAKAFSLLARQYANPIKAIIQELAANAVDSQSRAGQSRPFDVYMPSSLDETFYIRDYGTSMSEEVVYNVYTSYMASDKSKSNSEIGMFGIGSKTPFAYVDQYWVITYLDGVETQYLMTKNEDHVPELIEFSKQDTTEPNGVKISFTVNPTDVGKFNDEAINVLKWFVDKPNVLNNHQTKKAIASFSVTNFSNKMFVAKKANSSYYDRPSLYLRMGNIVYPTNSVIEIIKNGYDIIYDIPIGAADVTPSRENLESTPKTLTCIRNVLAQTKQEIEAYIHAQLNKLTGSLYEKYQQSQNLVIQYIDDYQINGYLTRKGLNFSSNYNIKSPHSFYKYDFSSTKNSLMRKYSTDRFSCESLFRYDKPEILIYCIGAKDETTNLTEESRLKIKHDIVTNHVGTGCVYLTHRDVLNELNNQFGLLSIFKAKIQDLDSMPIPPKKVRPKRKRTTTTSCYNMLSLKDEQLDQTDPDNYYCLMSDQRHFMHKVTDVLFPKRNVWALYANQVRKKNKMVLLTDAIINNAISDYVKKQNISDEQKDQFLIQKNFSTPYYTSTDIYKLYIKAYKEVYGKDYQKMPTKDYDTIRDISKMIGGISYSQKLLDTYDKLNQVQVRKAKIRTIINELKPHFTQQTVTQIQAILEKEA